MTKTLLIGQAPGPNTDPARPLYPFPASSAGGRLCKFMGISVDEYLEIFDRVNLLQEFPGKEGKEDKFPPRLAKVAAAAILPLLEGRAVVFLGRNVANSFGYSALGFHSWDYHPGLRMQLACVPHSSGRSHWYNSPENVQRSIDFWQEHIRGRKTSGLRLLRTERMMPATSP